MVYNLSSQKSQADGENRVKMGMSRRHGTMKFPINFTPDNDKRLTIEGLHTSFTNLRPAHYWPSWPN